MAKSSADIPTRVIFPSGRRARAYAPEDGPKPLIWMPSSGSPVAGYTGYTGKGIGIAIIDSGIDTAHPDLAPAAMASTPRNVSAAPSPVVQETQAAVHAACLRMVAVMSFSTC